MTNVPITLSVSDEFFRKLQAQAQVQKVTVEELVFDVLTKSLRVVEKRYVPSSKKEYGPTIEMAKLAFQSARDEILLRLKQREVVILAYLAGSFALLGSAITAGNDWKFYLACVAPLASLIVAVNVGAHIKAIEDLAEFIRFPFNLFMKELGFWAPLWDLSGRWDDPTNSTAKASNESGRANWREYANLLSIHLPSLISLVVASFFLRTALSAPCSIIEYGQHKEFWLLVVSALVWIGAICLTVVSFKARNNVDLPGIYVPEKYEFVKTAKKRKPK